MVPDVLRGTRGLGGAVWRLAGASLALFVSFWLLDHYLFSPQHGTGPFTQLTRFDPETLQNALGNLAQVIAAILGIAITVASIVVQLAATRYTSRVAEMFFRDRTNLAVMGFFVVACLDSVWVSLTVSSNYVPTATVLLSVVLVTGSLLLLVPYFAYVFDFLDPEKVIARIGEQTLQSTFGRGTEPDEIAARQVVAIAGTEQLADVAVNALSQKDKVIATDAIAALRLVAAAYLPHKAERAPGWFVLSARARENPDFVALAAESVADIEERRTWLEWKVLREFRTVFVEALKSQTEMAHVVAIETRYVGEAALAARDREALALAVKYFNTHLRASLNARDVRTAYNVFNQYRLLTEAALRQGLTDEAVTAAGHFKYYGQLAHGMRLGFVTETAAYDLCAVCELAFDLKSAAHDRLLAIFLEVDKEAESAAEEKALRGVRKAQVKLATHYLLHGAESFARQIFHDMAAETPDRLRSIRNEMLAIASKDFWEVTDRGTNFDYLPDNRKAKLRDFFAWFPRLTEELPMTGTPAPTSKP